MASRDIEDDQLVVIEDYRATERVDGERIAAEDEALQGLGLSERCAARALQKLRHLARRQVEFLRQARERHARVLHPVLQAILDIAETVGGRALLELRLELGTRLGESLGPAGLDAIEPDDVVAVLALYR